MSLDVVRQVYERFGEGDIEGFLDLCAHDIEWVVNGPSVLEKCRAFKGTTGVRDFLSILDRTWAFTSFMPREFIDGGEKVVVLGEETGTDKATGQAFQNRWAHVFTTRGGRIVTFREFLCHWLDESPPSMSWQ